MKRLIPIIVTTLFIITSPSYADYHYASHTGSNTYPYTSWETAADSIINAIVAAEPYDTVYIGLGTYNEAVVMGAADSAITFIGRGIDSTLVWRDTLSLWDAANYSSFYGITFRNNTTGGCLHIWFDENIKVENCRLEGLGWGVFGSAQNMIIENCQFEGFFTVVGSIDYVKYLVFRNNYCHTRDVGDNWFFMQYFNGIVSNNIFINDARDINYAFNDFSYTDSLIFQNNFISRLMATGPLLFGNRKRNAVITNNTFQKIAHNRYYYNYAVFYSGTGDTAEVYISNNAISQAWNGIGFTLGGQVANHGRIGYNCFWVDSLAIISNLINIDTIGNIYKYPMFVNPDSHDVHLQAYSPLIDAGDPNILDVDGSRSDIGVFGGPGGSSYQYQDLPPKTPDSLSFRVSGDSIILRWRGNYEADFWRYIINRDTLSGFTPWAGNIIGEPDTSFYIDTRFDREHNYFFKIAAYDNQGNLSPYSSELRVNIVEIEGNSGVELPSITQIESNYPNPFNSSTTIIYTVANLGPIPAQINIDIYDIGGRKVRGLIDNKEEVGRHQIVWDGRDDNQRELASGVYFAKITQWNIADLAKTQKLVLVR